MFSPQPEATCLETATGGSSNYDQTKPYGGNNVPAGAVPKRDDGAIATETTAPKADGNGYIVKGRYGARNMDFNSSDYALSPTEISEVKAFEQSTGVKLIFVMLCHLHLCLSRIYLLMALLSLYLFLVQEGRIMSCSTFIHQRCLSINNAF